MLQRGETRLVVTNGKLQIVETEKVSSSSTGSEAVALRATDAERHPFPTMNNAASESPSNSRTEEAWNIGGEKPIRKKKSVGDKKIVGYQIF